VPRRVGVGLAAASVAGLALWNLHAAVDLTPPTRTRPWRQYYAAMRWIGASLPEDAVVLCRKPYLGYLLAHRRTVGVPRTTDPAAYRRTLRQHGVDYVVLDRLPLPGTREVVIPRIREAPRDYVPVHAVGRPPLVVLRYQGRR
jgi:hypothetical protein